LAGGDGVHTIITLRGGTTTLSVVAPRS
jgi:hypothetical protein